MHPINGFFKRCSVLDNATNKTSGKSPYRLSAFSNQALVFADAIRPRRIIHGTEKTNIELMRLSYFVIWI